MKNVLLKKAKGKDFTKCEECGVDLPEGKAEMHHTKYEGATINDIKIVCHPCNMKPENRFLK